MSNTTHNALLTTTAVIAAAYAVGLLVAPASSIKLFGLDADVAGVWLARIVGVCALALAAVTFLARHLDALEARRALDGGLLIGFAAALAITMWAQYLRVANALGWINVAIVGALAVAYFYFLAAEDRAVAHVPARPA